MSLTGTTLRRPVTTLMACLTLVVLGTIAVQRLKLSFLPDVDFPFIGVQVAYPNAIPSQVEREIAKPIEEVLATLGDVEEIFSTSNSQGCFVGVTFKFGRQVDILRMEVKEKLDQVRGDLPADVRDLQILTFNSNDIPILVGRISAKDIDLARSYELLERKVIKPFERIEGVGRVNVDGISPSEVSIYLRMDAIKEHSIDVNRVFRELNSNNLNLSVGKVTRGGLRYSLRTLGAFATVEEIRNLRISEQGLVLSDIAKVVDSEPESQWYRRLNGESAIAFEIQKASGANTVEVARNVKKQLELIRNDPALSGVDVVLFFNQADEILESLNGLLISGFIGSLLSILILYFFLRHLRTTLIVSIAIPFSILGTCAYLYLTGKTLNLLTMMGLMLAVGMLVDNAIVVIESIYRHLVRGQRGKMAAEAGTREVGVAVVASTLTSVIVFAPIVLGGGNEIVVWLREVGITLSVTLLLSLLISLTLVPLMSSRLAPPKTGEPSLFIARMQEKYERVLRWTTLEHPVRTFLMILALIPLTIGMMAVTGIKPEAFGDRGVKRNNLQVRLRFSDNVNVYKADEYVARAEEYLLAHRDSLGAEVYSFFADNRGEITLFFDHTVSESEAKSLRALLRQELPELAGVTYEMGDDSGPSKGSQRLQVSLYGEDSEMLEHLSLEAKRRLALIPGLEEVRTSSENGRQEIHVVVDHEQASRFGINPSSVATLLNLTFRGVELRDLQADDREIPMSIILKPEDRKSLESLQNMTISLQDGQPIALGQVADFRFKHTQREISREDQRTAVSVIASYEGDDFATARKTASDMMNALALPAGYYWTFGRQAVKAQQEQSEMLINVLMALACVYFVMAALFESLLHPMVIMSSVLFAVFGVIWFLALTHTPLNIMAMIGIVVLIGVIVNNGIVLISHINFLRRQGSSMSEAILAGGRERFRPILMTAATTILGLLPLALGGTAMSGAQYYPMARALIGGLLSGTVLTLIVLPTFYVLAERQFAWLQSVWKNASISPAKRLRQSRSIG